MKTIYYTVEKETQDIDDGIEECTGNKTVSVYTVKDNGINLWHEISTINEDNSLVVIKECLSEDGFDFSGYTFTQL